MENLNVDSWFCGYYNGEIECNLKSDPEKQKEVVRANLHESTIKCINIISPKVIVCGCGDEFIRVLNVKTGRIIEVSEDGGNVLFVRYFSFENSKCIIAIYEKGIVNVYHYPSLEVLTSTTFARRNSKNIAINDNINVVAKNPAFNSLFAVLYKSGNIILWLAEKKLPYKQVYYQQDSINNFFNIPMALEWNTNGDQLFWLAKKSLCAFNCVTGVSNSWTVSKDRFCFKSFSYSNNHLWFLNNSHEISILKVSYDTKKNEFEFQLLASFSFETFNVKVRFLNKTASDYGYPTVFVVGNKCAVYLLSFNDNKIKSEEVKSDNQNFNYLTVFVDAMDISDQ